MSAFLGFRDRARSTCSRDFIWAFCTCDAPLRGTVVRKYRDEGVGAAGQSSIRVPAAPWWQEMAAPTSSSWEPLG